MARTDHSEIFSIIISSGSGETILDNQNIVQCYFIEDIYSWCMAGKLVLTDTRAIIEFLPLVGDETITIIYSSWDVDGGDTLGDGDGEGIGGDGGVAVGDREEKTFTFDIFKISEISDISESRVGTREQTTMYGIEIFFVQKEHKSLHQEYYSRTYYDFGLYTDIVADMSDRYLGINDWTQFEEGVEEIEWFHTGLRTPAQGIRWLMERTKGAEVDESGYMFYHSTEESEVSWNFITLENLLENGTFLEVPVDGIYTMGSANQHNLNNLTNITISNVDESSLNKLAACNMLGYDNFRKYGIKKQFVYQDGVDKYTVLGDFTLFNKDNIALKKPQEILTGESGDKYVLAECLMTNMHFSDWVKQYCLQQLVSVIVRGDIRRYCGGQIEINWLSGNTDEKFNKNMMGRYLVKSVTHQFSGQSNPQYIQKMVLIKNGYWASDAKLTKASKPKLDRKDFITSETSALKV